ncbi:MAG: RNA methyltransferase [Bacteroidia bacterium]|nr:RNA methyltransferase [Bacteroidia bacterium]
MQNSKRTGNELNRISLQAFKANPKLPLILILDNLRSGHNIGSVFRTADAFNVNKIYLTGISAVPPNKEILKTALGSTESIDWQYMEDAKECILKLKAQGIKVYAIEQTVSGIFLQNFKYLPDQALAVIFGNEVDGVNQELIDLCEGSIEIPQFGTKHSLNVSVSAGIVLWHLVNQLLTFNK